jgi:stress response protein SCP2
MLLGDLPRDPEVGNATMKHGLSKEVEMYTIPQKFRSPELSSGRLSVSICYPHLDPDDGVIYADLACWMLQKKYRHAYPVSVENSTDLNQGVEMKIFHNPDLQVGTSQINVNLSVLGEQVDQLVFVLNQLDDFLDFDQSKTAFVIEHDQVEIARFPFDFSTIGREDSVVLAVFDRDKLTWGFPGIAVRNIDLVMHDFEFGDRPTPFTESLDSDFPSALGLQGPDHLSDEELFHLLKWGPEGFLRNVKPNHLKRMSLKQGEEILAHYRDALSNEDMIPVRVKLMKALMKMGVDWAASISEEAGRMAHLEDKIDELILVAHWKKSWARVISKTLSNENLIAYASSSKMKADYLYILEPRRCLLELVSDSLKAQVLEQDLGL